MRHRTVEPGGWSANDLAAHGRGHKFHFRYRHYRDHGMLFHAIALAHTLIEGRMNPTSVLLFIFYWGIEFHQATGSAGACEVAPIAGVHR